MIGLWKLVMATLWFSVAWVLNMELGYGMGTAMLVSLSVQAVALLVFPLLARRVTSRTLKALLFPFNVRSNLCVEVGGAVLDGLAARNKGRRGDAPMFVDDSPESPAVPRMHFHKYGMTGQPIDFTPVPYDD